MRHSDEECKGIAFGNPKTEGENSEVKVQIQDVLIDELSE